MNCSAEAHTFFTSATILAASRADGWSKANFQAKISGNTLCCHMIVQSHSGCINILEPLINSENIGNKNTLIIAIKFLCIEMSPNDNMELI